MSTPTVGAHAQPQSATKPETLELGKINVKAIRELVKTLQEVKVALMRPFDDNPKHVDDMVCRLHAGVVHVEPWLECGNEGWFSRRRNATQRGLAGGWSNVGSAGMQQAVDAGSSATTSPSSEYGHPWHTVRVINRRQIIYFRQILKALPAPGKGAVVVVDAKGKSLVTVKANAQSGTDGTN